MWRSWDARRKTEFGYFWLIRANHQQDALTGCSLRLMILPERGGGTLRAKKGGAPGCPLGSHPSRVGDAGIEPAAACALVRRMVVAMMAGAQMLRPVPTVFVKVDATQIVLSALKRQGTYPPTSAAC